MSSEASQDAVLPEEPAPAEVEAAVQDTETAGLGVPPSKRRRRQHKKKKKKQKRKQGIHTGAPANQSSCAEGEQVDAAGEGESYLNEEEEEGEPVQGTAVRQPFQRIIFDEDGQACEVVLRTGLQAQVNRRQQKRLATSNYNWSDAAELASSATPVLSTVSSRKRPPAERLGRTTSTVSAAAKNLENDYSTVVNYWYTTLEWLDKNAYETEMNAQYVDPEEVTGVLDEFSTALEADLERLRAAAPIDAVDAAGDDEFCEPGVEESGPLES